MAELAIDVAREVERAEITNLINEAYEVETGDSGVAFKNTLRLLPSDAAQLDLGRTFVCRRRGHPDGPLLGCIVYDVQQDDTGLRCHFGPFAVARAAQGQGVGRALQARLETWARDHGCASFDIEVVNHRTDILPMYERQGFVAYGNGTFPAPERTTRQCHFILMRKPLAKAVPPTRRTASMHEAEVAHAAAQAMSPTHIITMSH